MKRSWYSDMQRLARRTDEPLWSVIAVVRAKAHWKARQRMSQVVGQPEEAPEGCPYHRIPVFNKRSGKVVGLMIGRRYYKRCGKLKGIRAGRKPRGKA